MGHASRGESHPAVGDQTLVAQRIIQFLRRRHGVKVPEATCADTGIPAGTVQKWLDRGSAPSAMAVFRLIGAYGPEFVAAVLIDPPAWLDRARREEEAARLKAEIAALEARLARKRT